MNIVVAPTLSVTASIVISLSVLFVFFVYSKIHTPELYAAPGSKHMVVAVILNLIGLAAITIAPFIENDSFVWIFAITVAVSQYFFLCWLKLYTDNENSKNKFLTRPFFAFLLLIVLALEVIAAKITGHIPVEVFLSPDVVKSKGAFLAAIFGVPWGILTAQVRYHEARRAIKKSYGLDTDLRTVDSNSLVGKNGQFDLDLADRVIGKTVNPIRGLKFRYRCWVEANTELLLIIVYWFTFLGIVGNKLSGIRQIEELTDVLRTPFLLGFLGLYLATCFADGWFFQRYTKSQEEKAARYLNNEDLRWFVYKVAATLSPSQYQYEPFGFSEMDESALSALDDVLLFLKENREEVGQAESFLVGPARSQAKRLSLIEEAHIWEHHIQNGLPRKNKEIVSSFPSLNNKDFWETAYYYCKLARTVRADLETKVTRKQESGKWLGEHE